MDKELLRENIERFCGEVDGEKWTKFVADYAKIGDSKVYGGKHGGSDAEHTGSRYIAQQLKEIGVPEVELVAVPTSKYQFNDANLVIADKVLKPYGYRSPGTEAEGITAEIIDVGQSTMDDYRSLEEDGVSASGKIVLFEGMGALEAFNLSAQIDEAEAHGAKAAVIYMTEDILNEDTIRVQTPLNILTIPVVGISVRDAKTIKDQISRGNTEATIQVDADYEPDKGTTYNVVGKIPGEKSEEIIVFSSHLDHFFRCVQDNISSSAALLGIADAIIRSNYKPNRTILFAFHGSHECGIIDSKYPYITGVYEMVQQKLPEWKGRIIADINLEYAALPLEELKAGSTLGAEGNIMDYLQYAPQLKGGFKTIGTGDIPLDAYSMMSWVDVIGYSGEGIPSYTNDVITEQFEGKSPYIGRDHSNHDDMNCYCEKALIDSIDFYGGLGIYLDACPAVRIDFARQSERMDMESHFDRLKDHGIETAEYQEKLQKLANASAELTKLMNEINHGNNGNRSFREVRPLNKDVLELNDWFQEKLDKIAASDFLTTASGKCIQNALLLEEAADLMSDPSEENIVLACEKLFEVDLASTSYYFEEKIVEKMRAQISDKEYESRRTWARGREMKCLTLYDLMKSLKKKTENRDNNFTEEITEMSLAAKGELDEAVKELKKEMIVIEEGTERIKKLCQTHQQ